MIATSPGFDVMQKIIKNKRSTKKLLNAYLYTFNLINDKDCLKNNTLKINEKSINEGNEKKLH